MKYTKDGAMVPGDGTLVTITAHPDSAYVGMEGVMRGTWVHLPSGATVYGWTEIETRAEEAPRRYGRGHGNEGLVEGTRLRIVADHDNRPKFIGRTGTWGRGPRGRSLGFWLDKGIDGIEWSSLHTTSGWTAEVIEEVVDWEAKYHATWEALHAEAKRRGWCDVYDEFVRANGGPARKVMKKVGLTVEVQVEVDATASPDAVRAAAKAALTMDPTRGYLV